MALVEKPRCNVKGGPLVALREVRKIKHIPRKAMGFEEEQDKFVAVGVKVRFVSGLAWLYTILEKTKYTVSFGVELPITTITYIPCLSLNYNIYARTLLRTSDIARYILIPGRNMKLVPKYLRLVLRRFVFLLRSSPCPITKRHAAQYIGFVDRRRYKSIEASRGGTWRS
ncbi:hypothetical protein K445DRAFT_14846 [Daldinia sp. EC12]|nr:hypothetical protein K445DRAFT_14846 [Daldinia sp. EC12]